MEFQIEHRSRIFARGMQIPGLAFMGALLLMVIIGVTLQNGTVLMIFCGFSAVLAVIEVIFMILSLIEIFYGAKVIVNSDHLDIRMVLRRKRIPFDQIEETKYSHYEGTKYPRYRSDDFFGDYTIVKKLYGRKYFRTQLDIFLSSGKHISLTDNANGYSKKRKQAQVNPSINPDEDIRLYQAYQCYRSAVDQYAREHGLQIPR